MFIPRVTHAPVISSSYLQVPLRSPVAKAIASAPQTWSLKRRKNLGQVTGSGSPKVFFKIGRTRPKCSRKPNYYNICLVQAYRRTRVGQVDKKSVGHFAQDDGGCKMPDVSQEKRGGMLAGRCWSWILRLNWRSELVILR